MVDISVAVVFSLLTVLLCKVALCQNKCKPKDCIDLKCYRVSTAHDGPHTVYPGIAKLPTKLNVSCDQLAHGGGWTVVLRRCSKTGTTNFSRSLEEYKNAFGLQDGPDSEFYLGNEIIHQLTVNYPSKNGEIRIEGVTFQGTTVELSADMFSLDTEAKKYAFRVGTEHDNSNVSAGALIYHKDKAFTYGTDYCKGRYDGVPWWFKSCTRFYMFGIHSNKTIIHGQGRIYIFSAAGLDHILQRGLMMIRPYKDTRQCDNPCKNGATCKYVATDDTHLCVCPQTHCGALCEKENMCKNGGTCLYDAATKKYSCKCAGGISGKICADITSSEVSGADSTSTEAASGKVKMLIPIISSILLIVLICLAVAGFMIYKRNKKQEEEKEEEERQRKLEEEQEEDEYGFLSMFGM